MTGQHTSGRIDGPRSGGEMVIHGQFTTLTNLIDPIDLGVFVVSIIRSIVGKDCFAP